MKLNFTAFLNNFQFLTQGIELVRVFRFNFFLWVSTRFLQVMGAITQIY